MRAHRGFTLLELVVALAVSGAALAAGGAAFATLVDRRTQFNDAAMRDERALAARRQLVQWISGAQRGTSTDGPFVGIGGVRRTTAGEVRDDALQFLTRTDGALARVQVFIDRSSPRPQLVAVRTSRAEPLVRTVLAEDVAGFEVSYLTTAFGHREWRRSWSAGALLPAAVQLVVHPASGATLPAPLRLPITVPLANAQ